MESASTELPAAFELASIEVIVDLIGKLGHLTTLVRVLTTIISRHA